RTVTGVQTCALPILRDGPHPRPLSQSWERGAARVRRSVSLGPASAASGKDRAVVSDAAGLADVLGAMRAAATATSVRATRPQKRGRKSVVEGKSGEV